MILPKPQDAKHKNQMYRLLRRILQNSTLANNLQFKGGTYAALRGVLDRFSIDLDFDLPDKDKKQTIRKECYRIFDQLDLQIKDESQKHLQFFLRYQASQYERNTLKLEINDQVNLKNQSEKVYLLEVNMYCNAHTLGTMVANKLIAAKARFDRHHKIAGRDFYDLHRFLVDGRPINKKAVEEGTKMTYIEYLKELLELIKEEVKEALLYQDLNPLLPPKKLNSVIKVLKPELITLLTDEIKRFKSST